MPLSADQLHLVMMELGPASPEIVQLVTDESGNWGVLLDDQTQVHLSLRDAPTRLELAAIVGTLPEEAPEVMAMLLTFNLMSHETGGARMALSADERDVYLMMDLPEAAVDLPGLQSALQTFAGLAQTWRSYLADGCQTTEPDAMSNHLMQPV